MVRQTRIMNEQLARELACVLEQEFGTFMGDRIRCEPEQVGKGLWRVKIEGERLSDNIYPFVAGYLKGRSVVSGYLKVRTP